MSRSVSFGNNEIVQVADAVAREKGISRDSVIEAMENAIQTAGKRKYGHKHNIKAEIDSKNGEVKLFRGFEVVEEVEVVLVVELVVLVVLELVVLDELLVVEIGVVVVVDVLELVVDVVVEAIDVDELVELDVELSSRRMTRSSSTIRTSRSALSRRTSLASSSATKPFADPS